MGLLITIEKWAENLDEATVSEWLKAEGDAIEAGEPLCEIITDKATFQYEPEEGGVVHRLYAAPKSTVPVGYAIAFIGERDEAPPAGVEEKNATLLAQHQQKAALELDLDLPPRRSARRVRATPAARRAARNAGIELQDVAASIGENRPVTDADVADYLASMEGT